MSVNGSASAISVTARLLLLLLLLLATTVVVVNGNSTAAADRNKPAVSSTSGRYVRLQLEDLELDVADTVTAIQADDQPATSSSVVPSSSTECLPLSVDGLLSTVCRHRASARYPDLLGHADEARSAVEVQRSASRRRLLGVGSVGAGPTDAACRALVVEFVCAVYAPPCSSGAAPLVPCRRLCQSARDRCLLRRRVTWPDDWTCSRLPAETMCVDEKSSTVVGQHESMNAVGRRKLQQPAPPVSTLPLPPRTPAEDASSSSSGTPRRQRLQQRVRRRTRKSVDATHNRSRPMLPAAAAAALPDDSRRLQGV